VKPEETCNSAHEQTSLCSDTIDFVLRDREGGQPKELSEHTRISNFHSRRRIKMICDNCHCENNKTFLLINTTFPPIRHQLGKHFLNEREKRKTNFHHILDN